MKKIIAKLVFILVAASCSNTPELETGDIKAVMLLKDAFDKSKNDKGFVDARNLLTREQISAAAIPILFVELKSGQNGTLTPYPGKGLGETWLGADGATITMERGILKASRGMGDDLMGAVSSMPAWSTIGSSSVSYTREVSYITGNNKISKRLLVCKIKKNNTPEIIKIWEINFNTSKYEEDCKHDGLNITNTYYLDNKNIVRQSHQYHSQTLGYIFTQRLDK